MKILDSLAKKKKEVAKNKKTNVFVCGPTVYDHSHIGHARTYLAFDIAVRYLRARGFDVFYLQNITDIDDKIIKRAAEENKTTEDLSDFFTEEYYKDMKSLGIDSVDSYARASDHIPQIISQVERLMEKGYAYEVENDGIYFDITKFAGYGKLSGRTAEQAEDATSRIDDSIKKRNKGDFVLWKFSKPGEPKWESPWGEGRPGWHIEDTAITESFFGPQYDIHGGADELKFPHHEAEIAQQESASGKEPFVNIWMHTGVLDVGGKKMSKSLKNFITIKDFLSEHGPDVLRWIVFSHHYRSRVDYTESLVHQAQSSLANIFGFLDRMNFVFEKSGSSGSNKVNVDSVLAGAKKDFHAEMSDDLNTPKAAAVIFSLINEVEKDTWNLSGEEAKKTGEFILEIINILGLKTRPEKVPEKVKKMAEEREELRGNQQFIKADEVRDKMGVLGYDIEDTPLGPFVKKRVF